MSTFSTRTLLKNVVLLAILLPLVSLSQVKIKEKVEIKPKSPVSLRAVQTNANTSGLFYKPTLFVWDSVAQKPMLTLPSVLTISGRDSLGQPIGANEEIVVTYNPTQYQDIQIAWKGRTTLASGGTMYEGLNPFTGAFDANSLWSPPDIRLLLFDNSGWGNGSGGLSWPAGQLSSDSLVYSFQGSLWQGGGTYVPMTASGLVAGNFQQNVQFAHWYLDAGNTTVSCYDSTTLYIVPYDGNWNEYLPNGLSLSDAGIVVKLAGAGDYAYLKGAGQEGHDITTTLADGCKLVFDPSRGGFSGESQDVQVTLTGGGKSATMTVTLLCERLHHFRVLAGPRMLAPGRSSAVKSIPQDRFNQDIPPPGNYDVTFSLNSPDVMWPRFWGPPPVGGFAVDGGEVHVATITVPDDVARSGRVTYVVDDNIFQTFGLDSLRVVITVYEADNWSKTGSTEVKVKRAECVSVSVTPDTLAPGATATISLGTSGQYPADEAYDVVIVGGGANGGTLVSPSGSGTELIGIMGPVQYIAPSTIDSTMNIQIAALAYGRGGGYPAGVQAGVAPSSKKLTSVVATQSLSKVAREARISAIARLLASDQCLFGPNLVVEQNDPFADCQDATTWTTHTIDRTGKEDKRCDDPDRRPGEPMKMAYSWMYLGPGDFPNPTIGICRDRSDGKTIYRFKIERLQVYFNYLFCAQNVSTIGAIYKSLADLTSDQACQAKRDLEDRLPVLRDRSRKEKELALPVGGKYVLREELEAHELAHLRQDSIAIKNAMQVIAERILSKANLNTLSQAIAEFNNESNMKARATLVRGAIEAEIKMQQTKKARTYELAAQSAEAAKIESSLIPQLSKKCK